MRLLIGGSPSKIFHLKDFQDALVKLGVKCKLVTDTDICNGFPSRKIFDWFQTQKKFDELISDFKPDVILVDRQRHFAKIALKYKIPLIIHLRGNIWKEIEWAKHTTYKSFPKKLALQIWEKISKETFQKSSLIVPICKHLDEITKENYPDKVREYLTEIDVYALVSGIDMSPLTLQEAQLMKKPVVATNVGGIPELMKDNETGFLVEKGNSKEWIEKLSILMDDKEKRKKFGNNGRKFVEENFSWNRVAKEFLKDLEKNKIL